MLLQGGAKHGARDSVGCGAPQRLLKTAAVSLSPAIHTGYRLLSSLPPAQGDGASPGGGGRVRPLPEGAAGGGRGPRGRGQTGVHRAPGADPPFSFLPSPFFPSSIHSSSLFSLLCPLSPLSVLSVTCSLGLSLSVLCHTSQPPSLSAGGGGERAQRCGHIPRPGGGGPGRGGASADWGTLTAYALSFCVVCVSESSCHLKDGRVCFVLLKTPPALFIHDPAAADWLGAPILLLSTPPRRRTRRAGRWRRSRRGSSAWRAPLRPANL